ncbi:hypothetical protein ACFLSJ_05875 [Verrucomicrobiota bacterium]
MQHGSDGCERPFRFNTRNFKMEVGIGNEMCRLPESSWETAAREIVAMGFTGVVFYGPCLPFEHILDFKTMPEAVEKGTARKRAANRRACNRVLAVMKRHGLQTFMQHYIMHFTAALARNIGIDIAGESETRLAGYDTPAVRRFCRYCYREVFKQCPDLDGLYFNFESTGSACDHVLNTAVREANRMKKKPIFVYRLWGMRDVDGMRDLVRVYKGRSIFGHKIMDTADTYHLPVADGRVVEWKKQVQGIEFMFLVGPCHNCGTNIAGQVWGDYDYVQQLLADAERKGCDSISFHSVEHWFPPDDRTDFSSLPHGLAHWNIMHLAAVADYIKGVTRPVDERCALMAERLGVGKAAASAAYKAVVETSQAVPLIHQQFVVTSSFEGYWMPYRTSLIQDPFLYLPASALSTQARRPQRSSAWAAKTEDTPCGEKNLTQYIIDYVDPDKPVAKRHPRAMAAMIRKSCESAVRHARQYRRLVGAEKGDRFLDCVIVNHASGMWGYHLIMAGIELYSVYFARTRAGVVRALEKGLEHLKQARRLELKDKYRARIARIYFYYTEANLTTEIKGVRRALSLVKNSSFPMRAYSAYLKSRREYNEIKRYIRAGHEHSPAWLRRAAAQLGRAARTAETALPMLQGSANNRLRQAVQSWIDFLAEERRQTAVPSMKCPREAKETSMTALVHEQCFRWGEYYFDDFAEFFRAGDVHRNTDHLSFRIGHTRTSLVVTLREEGVDVRQRLAQWKAFEGTSDELGCLRVHVAADPSADFARKPGAGVEFHVLPGGRGMRKRPSLGFLQNAEPEKIEFRHDATSWDLTCHIPFRQIGARPAPGDVWAFNIISNTAILRNHQNSWCRWNERGRDLSADRMGRIEFE